MFAIAIWNMRLPCHMIGLVPFECSHFGQVLLTGRPEVSSSMSSEPLAPGRQDQDAGSFRSKLRMDISGGSNLFKHVDCTQNELIRGGQILADISLGILTIKLGWVRGYTYPT